MALVQSHFEFVLPVFLFLSYSFGIDTIKMFILARSSQPRPQGFSLKWVGPPHPFFKGKALGTRLPFFPRKPNPIPVQNEQSVYPFSDQNGVYIREYPPPRVAGSISAATSALHEKEEFELISPTG